MTPFRVALLHVPPGDIGLVLLCLLFSVEAGGVQTVETPPVGCRSSVDAGKTQLFSQSADRGRHQTPCFLSPSWALPEPWECLRPCPILFSLVYFALSDSHLARKIQTEDKTVSCRWKAWHAGISSIRSLSPGQAPAHTKLSLINSLDFAIHACIESLCCNLRII